MKQSMKEDLLFLGAKIMLFLVLLVITFGVVFGVHRNIGDDMNPVCKNGDLLLYYRLQKEYQANDLVVIEKNREKEVRRIIAKEGERVDITENGLEINGYLQQENNIYMDTLPYKEGIQFPVTVGQGEYFVLGDNRTNAKDSRIYGVVKKKEIKGGVIALLRRSEM